MNSTQLPPVSVAKSTKWVPCTKNMTYFLYYNASESWGAMLYKK